MTVYTTQIVKSTYQFYLNDEIKTLDDLPLLLSSGEIDQVEYDRRLSLYQSWLDSEEYNERLWRNAELNTSDYMLISDATYGGEKLVESDKLQDIIEYRNQLRRYNLRDEARPARPEWFVT
jgi:hypothetical protein